MIVIALLFDSVKFATGILALSGATNVVVAGTAVGGKAGAVVATIVLWLPFVGQIVGLIALYAGIFLQWIFGIILTILGYSTMGLWFTNSGVSLFGGKNPSGKVATFLITYLLSWVPFLDLLPGLTTWTVKMLYDNWHEDKENAKEAEGEYNKLDYSRVRKPRPTIKHARADTF